MAFINLITGSLSNFIKEDKQMSFDTKNGPVYEPENEMLIHLYEVLKKHAPSLSGSRAFDDLVEVYEALEFDMREEKSNEPIIRAV